MIRYHFDELSGSLLILCREYLREINYNIFMTSLNMPKASQAITVFLISFLEFRDYLIDHTC